MLLLALTTPIAARAFTDNINLPFKDDPAVIGRWKSVAFVQSPEYFFPENVAANDSLFLKEMVFLPQGKTPDSWKSWTQGVLIHSGDKTASKYVFKEIGGLTYMFLEWKSGDYTIRNRKPQYYVLIRDSDLSKIPKTRAADEDSSVVNFTDCLVSVPPGGICKHPLPRAISPKPLDSLPIYDPNSGKPLDLRGQDVSKLSLAGRANDLLYAEFDTGTKFPKTLPEGFAPNKIIEFGKNPGLGLRRLHKEGITGRGVSIAIIDQSLLVDHKEYAERVISYEELHWVDPWASMHAGAVASIAVGRDCGVAPEADLYFIANLFMDSRSVINFTFLARAIDRVIAFNEALPKGKKIRVLAIARGFAPHNKGYAEVTAAVGRAKRAGIFVVTSSLDKHYGFRFNGLGRDPMSDPDVKASYEPGLWWQHDFFSAGWGSSTQTLLVPMDSRTTASQAGVNDYVFYRTGGWSWSIPYIAGLYALACQVKPGITPEVFWNKALETGDSLIVKKERKEFRLERIVNPWKLIMSLKE